MAITLNGSTGITSPGGDTSTSLSTGLLTVTGSTVPANGMYLPTTNTLAWATNSTERLRLDASGNLGLGVTPSGWGSATRAIEIGASSSISNAGTTTGITVGANVYNNSGWRYKLSSELSTLYTQFNGTHSWSTAPSGTAGNAISFTQAMTLDASGNLGIGTTSPASPFEIVRNSSSGGSGLFPNIRLDNQNASGYTGLYFLNSGTQKAGLEVKNDVGALQFFTGSAERARIDSSGNLLVGTTTQANNAKITVFSDNTTAGGLAVASSASLYRQLYLTSTGTVLQFWNGSNQASLSAAGAWTNASDARLKKDIVDIKYGLSTVLQSKPRSFNRTDVAGEFIGFIAQELKDTIPEVVFGSDKEGDQYTVDYASMVAVAFKAIQELTARLEALEGAK